MKDEVRLDSIGFWSEAKLEILAGYAGPYSAILANQPSLHHIYIDAFAGAGEHVSRRTGAKVLGSPQIALQTEPPFERYYFIDLDRARVENLRRLSEGRSDVVVLQGDCNTHLLETVFPQARWEDRMRALCFIDPYGLHLDWQVIEQAGRGRSIDMFLNFPIMDMNRNALRLDRSPENEELAAPLTRFWGDESWRDVAFVTQPSLFDDYPPGFLKLGNIDLVKGFQERLKSVARFKYVPEPVPMRNSNGADLYYLFYASQNEAGNRIATYLFNRYRVRGALDVRSITDRMD